jgi:hypothetical protein
LAPALVELVVEVVLVVVVVVEVPEGVVEAPASTTVEDLNCCHSIE